jgi:D-glycero-alpha-D-manno-heptose-7-phosphate kinase
MSFVGGGSDLPWFYRTHGGAVVSTALRKFVYVSVNERFESGIRVSHRNTEEATTASEIGHLIVRKALESLQVAHGIEINTVSDLPSGTGLGSSSAFTVALLQVLNAYVGNRISCDQLARDSSNIEIDQCGEPIGKQDQYAAAYGGLNLIEFNPDDSVNVIPVACKSTTLENLETNIIVFYTGISRPASSILNALSRNSIHAKRCGFSLKRMVALAYDLDKELRKNNLDTFGEILHENWMHKQAIPGVTSSQIDEWYRLARNAGAVGGKILGAGAGGFLMFYAPLEAHGRIKWALRMLRHVPMTFEKFGSSIIFSA